MGKNAYGTWRVMAYESMVRAVVLRYFSDHGQPEARAQALEDDQTKGFLWTSDMADALAHGDAGEPWIRARRGALLAVLDDWSAGTAGKLAKRRAATGPQIALLRPAAGSLDVAPDLTSIEVTFDRPMGEGMAIVEASPKGFVGDAAWAADGRTLVVKVRLEPHTTYTVDLNPVPFLGFRDRQGQVLLPRAWNFSTR